MVRCKQAHCHCQKQDPLNTAVIATTWLYTNLYQHADEQIRSCNIVLWSVSATSITWMSVLWEGRRITSTRHHLSHRQAQMKRVDEWLSFSSQAQGAMTHSWHLTQGLDDLRNGRFVISCQWSDAPKRQRRPPALPLGATSYSQNSCSHSSHTGITCKPTAATHLKHKNTHNCKTHTTTWAFYWYGVAC